MCSLAFFFILYGFVGLRKFVRIEKVTVHPITFPGQTVSKTDGREIIHKNPISNSTLGNSQEFLYLLRFKTRCF